MSSAAPCSPFRGPHHSIARSFLWAAVVLVLLGLASVAGAHPGRWSPARDTSQDAMHMTLVPGDSVSYHSRILMWGGESNVLSNIHDGAEFGWNPPTTVSADTCGVWPYPNLATLLSHSTWNPPGHPLLFRARPAGDGHWSPDRRGRRPRD